MNYPSSESPLKIGGFRRVRWMLIAAVFSFIPLTGHGQLRPASPIRPKSAAPALGQPRNNSSGSLVTDVRTTASGSGQSRSERSVNLGSQAVTVVFSNQTNGNVIAHWIDQNGVGREIGTMVPRQSVALTTFPGHLTTFSSGNRRLATFRASSTSNSAYAIVGISGTPIKSGPAPAPATLFISSADFKGQAHVAREITMARGDKLSVTLASNASTGFSWGERIINSNPSVLKPLKYEKKGPRQTPGGSPPPPGAPGSEVWTFEALKSGVATLNFSYSQSWPGGTKGAQTLKVTARVR